MRTSKKFRLLTLAALLILFALPAASYLSSLMGNNSLFPGVHPVAGAPTPNSLGVSCAYGASAPGQLFPTPIQTKDGDITNVNTSCDWAGDVDGDGALDPLVSDTVSLLPAGSGGGFTADVVIANLNTSINGFDITIDYNPNVLSAAVVDQSGLLYGGNNGCPTANPSCTLTTAFSIDRNLGEVRVSQAVLGITSGPGGTCNTTANPACTSINQELFRIRFDIVGAGNGFINFSPDPLKNVITSPSPVPHTSTNSNLGTDALFNLINGQATGTFTASWSFSPNPEVPGSPLTFSATAATCSYCVAPFTYQWDFSSQDVAGYVVKIDATGQTVTLPSPPPPVVNRVTLTVADSAAHSVVATRRLPLTVTVSGPISAVQGTAVGPFVGKWLGGVVTPTAGYSGLWRFCPGTALSHPVCSSGPVIISQNPGATGTLGTITETSSVTSVSWAFAGLYSDFLSITDTAVTQISATATTVIAPFSVNVTGPTPAFTVAVSPNMTSVPAGHAVNVTATVTYAATYPPASKSTTFCYLFIWGDGNQDTVCGGLAVFALHTYATAGTFIVKVVPQETGANAPSQIRENGYSPPITVTGNFNYALAVTPNSATVTPGGSTQATVTATLSAGTTQSVTLTASGQPSGTTVAFNPPSGNPTFSSTMTITTSSTTPPGVYTITITGTSTGGVIRTTTFTLTVAAAFTVTISCPSTGTVGTAVSCSATSTGGTAPVTFTWTATGGSPATGTGATFSTTYSVKGTYSISVNGTDSATPHKSQVKTASITISPTPIILTVTGPTTGTAGTAVTFQASATGGTSPYTFGWSAPGGTPTSGTGVSFTVTYAVKGTYTINATATDTNNAKVFKLVTITISPLPLAVSVSGPASGSVGASLTFTATGSGGTSPYTFSWSAPGGTPATGTGASFTVSYSVKGSKTINVTITDTNNAKAFKLTTVTINGTPIVVTVTGPTSGTVGTAVTFTASATGGTTPFTFSWTAPGGTPATGTGASFTVTYNVKGTYTVNATATDANGAKAFKTASITIAALPLAVSVSGPASGSVGASLTYTATGSGGTSPYTFSWSAPGGTPATGTGASFIVSYSVKGSKTINVTITDTNNVKAFKLTTVTINPLPITVTVTGPTSGTVGTAVTFTASATGGTSPYTFAWTAPGGTPATGTGASFTVTYNVKGTYTVNATATDTNAAKAFKTASITIAALPLAVSVSGPASGTVGASLTYTATGSGGTSPYTFSWSAPGGTPATGTGASFTVSYSVKGSKTINVTITDTNNAKAFKLTTVTITGQPLVVTVTGPTSGTVGTAVTFTASATGGTSPYTFSWTATGGTPATGTGTSFTVTYNVKGTYVVNATVTDTNAAKAFKTASIVINPLPITVTVTGPTSGTVGTAVTFTASATGGTSPYTFAWTAPGGTPATGTGASFTVTYNVKGTYTVNATATDTNAAKAFKTASITIAPLPLAVAVSGPASGSVGASLTFTATGSGGTSPYTFSWSAPGGTPATGTGASFTVSYSVKGSKTINVTITDTNNAKAFKLTTVTINPLPLAVTVTGPTSGTAGTAVTFTASATGGTSPYTFSWTAPGGSPATGAGASFTVTYAVKGTYTVNATATDTNNAKAFKLATITINPVPLAVTVSGPATGMVGTAVTFTASATGGTAPYTFAWTAPGGTPATGTGASFTVTYNVKGTYIVNATATDGNGAKAFKTASIVISSTPVVVTVTGPTSGTVGTAVTFTASATGGTSPYTFAWTAPGGTPATGAGASFTVTYNVKGTYVVNATATDTNGAKAFKTATITIAPSALSVAVSGPATGTVGTAVTFTATGTGGTAPYTFSWSAPGGTPATGTGSSFTVSYSSKGTKTINATITDTNNAKAFKLATITINPLPVSVTVTGPSSGTVGTAVTFTASATGGTAPYTFAWTAPGGTPATGTGASFTVTYNVKGTYVVNATATDGNGAKAFKTASIAISSTPPVVTVTGPTTGTVGTAVTFTASATGGTAPYTFAWTAPGGTPATGTGTSFTVTYNVKGTYVVNATVTDTNGAKAFKTASIVISPTALAVAVSGPASGSVGASLTFTATGSGGTAPYTFSWSAPGGTPATGTGASFTVSYSVKGSKTINVTITDTNNAKAFKLTTVTINPLALAVTVSGPSTGTTGTAVTFTASATGGTSPYTFSWTAPGGTPATGTGASFTVTYAVKGTYTVNATATDTNAAKAFKTATIVIGAGSPLVVTVTGPSTGSVGTAVTFTASTTGGTAPYTFSWSAPGGTPATGTGSSFTVTYNVKGTYVVNATATDANGSKAFKTATILISSTPVAVTVTGPTSGTVGTAVTFTASATGGTAPYTFSWSAPGGTPTTGTGASFTVTYNIKGTYTVNATATDANGSKGFKTASITISPLALAVNFAFSPTSPTVGQSVTFTATVTGGTAPYSYTWNFGDGSALGTGNPVSHIYASKGTKTVNLTVSDANAAPASATHTVTVTPLALSVSVSGPAAGSVGTAVTFTASATGGTSPYTFSWTAPGGTPATGTGVSFTVTYNVKGTYVVNATATDTNSARASKTASIVISSTAPVVTVSGPASGTVGTSVTFTASATGGTSPYTFSWTAPGGTPATGTGASFTVTYNVKGTYTVNATVTDTNGAKAFKTATITIAPTALAVTVSGPASGSVGASLTFTATGSGGTAPYTFSWSAPGGTPATGTGSSFTVSYSVKGSKTINVTITDTNNAKAFKLTTVTINPVALSTDFTSNPATITPGTPVTFTATTTGGTSPYTYAWSFGDGSTGTGNPVSHTYATGGQFVVTENVTDTNGAKATATHTVGSILVVTETCPAAGTVGIAVTCTASATGGTPPVTFTWSAPGGNPATGTGTSFSTTYNVKGTVTISVTGTDSASPTHNTQTVSKQVVIAPLAITVSVTGPASGSVGTAVTFTASATGGTSPYTFSWTAPGGSPAAGTGASFTVTYNVKGTYTVNATATDTNNAKAFKTASIVISPQPLADSISGPSSGTVGTPVTFSASATGGTAPYTFTWATVGGTPSSGTGPTITVTYSVKGSYRVNATAMDSNGVRTVNPATVLISISSTPPAVSISGPATGMVGNPLTFTASATGGTAPYSFSWTAVGGSPSTGTGASFTVTYSVKGTYTVNATVTDTNGATARTFARVTISPQTLTVSFTVSANPTVGSPVTFTATATGGTSPYTFSWNFGDGTILSNGAQVMHTYTAKGTYQVSTTVTDSNTVTANLGKAVTVAPQSLTASFTFSPTSPVSGQQVTFTATASGGTSPYTFSWTFGDGSTGTGNPVTHIYSNTVTTTYNVTLTVTDTNAVKTFVSHNVIVGPSQLTVDFTFSPTAPTVGQSVTFTATSNGGTPPVSFSWSFGDGSTGTGSPASHTYTVKGTFTVTLTGTDSAGKTASATHMVTVTPLALAADFTFTPQAPTTGQSVTFTATASGGTAPYSYSWSFGDSTTGSSNPTSHTYTTKGSFMVTLTVSDTNGVRTTASHMITVTPLTLATDFTFNPTSPRTNQPVTFTATVTGGTSPYSYSWSFGDTATGTSNPVTHTYTAANTYTVTLTVTDANGKTATASHSVTVTPGQVQLTADFGPTNTIVGTTRFVAVISGGTSPYSCSWSFGDGTPIDASSCTPTHTYIAAGTYTVTLNVTDSAGSHATASHAVTVQPAPTDSISFSHKVKFGQAQVFTVTVNNPTSFTVNVNVTLDVFNQMTGLLVQEFASSMSVGPNSSKQVTFTFNSATRDHYSFSLTATYSATIPVGAGTSLMTTVTGTIPTITGNFKFK